MATEKAQHMTKRVADVLIETLQAAGVKTCYGIVGDTLNRIAHAIDRSEIDWVHMRHEGAGGGRDGGVHRQGDAAWQRARRLGNGGREHPLIE
jgi:hypothetical protein